MKLSLYTKVFIAAAAVAASQGAGAASVLAGFYDFNGVKGSYPPPNEPANELTAGFLGWVESPDQASSGGGGDLDGVYGNSGISVAVPAPSFGDGYASVRMYSSGSSKLSFKLTNNTGYSVDLTNLYFDAAASTGQIGRHVQIDFVTPFGTTPLGVFGDPVNGLVSSSPQNFDDFGVSLGNYLMAAGETVSFVFSAPAGSQLGTVLWIDNVAIVPEPGSLMALGCMVITGLFYRGRRK